MRYWPALACLLPVSACSDDQPSVAKVEELARQTLPASYFPTTVDIDRACDAAIKDMIRSAEEGGAIVDPSYHAFVSRAPRCRWRNEESYTATCEFEQAEIRIVLPTDQQIAEAKRRFRKTDWEPMTASLVRTGAGWKAQGGCQPRFEKPKSSSAN